MNRDGGGGEERRRRAGSPSGRGGSPQAMETGNHVADQMETLKVRAFIRAHTHEAGQEPHAQPRPPRKTRDSRDLRRGASPGQLLAAGWRGRAGVFERASVKDHFDVCGAAEVHTGQGLGKQQGQA